MIAALSRLVLSLGFAMAAAVPAAPAAHAQAAPAPTDTASWFSSDSATKTVILRLETTHPTGSPGALLNGQSGGHIQVIVPLGWTVQWEWRSADSSANHSLVVMAEREKLPTEGGRPAFDNAMTRMVQDGLPAGQIDRTTFIADQPGWYWVLCGVPSHAIGGEYLGLRVDPGARTGGVRRRWTESFSLLRCQQLLDLPLEPFDQLTMLSRYSGTVESRVDQPDLPIAAEKDGRRKRSEPTELRQRFPGRLDIVCTREEQREGDAELVTVSSDLFRIHGGIPRYLVCQSDDLEPARVVLPVEVHQNWCGLVARWAPAAENIHDHDFSSESTVVLSHESPVEIGRCEAERRGRVGARDFGGGFEVGSTRASNGLERSLGSEPRVEHPAESVST
jgi:hypothetical protein